MTNVESLCQQSSCNRNVRVGCNPTGVPPKSRDTVLHLFLHELYVTGSRIPLLKTPVPASYIAVEEAVGVIRERCYRDDQTPVLKSEQFR